MRRPSTPDLLTGAAILAVCLVLVLMARSCCQESQEYQQRGRAYIACAQQQQDTFCVGKRHLRAQPIQSVQVYTLPNTFQCVTREGRATEPYAVGAVDFSVCNKP